MSYRLLHSEKGQVLIFFAALLPVAIAFLGFTLDIGRLQLVSVQLQTAVDAASLAGASTAKTVVVGDDWGNIYAKFMRLDESTAQQAAYDCLLQNIQKIPQAALQWYNIIPNTADCTVEVEARVRIPTYFMGIVGRTYLETYRRSMSTAIPD